MGEEIERKFLVRDGSWRDLAHKSTRLRQGYLCTDPDRTVRVRTAGNRGFLTIKGKMVNLARAEYEYPLPADDANEILDRLSLRPLIEKTRYLIDHAGLTWEVDEFAGENQGLIVAEVELVDAEQSITLPDWVAEEVSGDKRYLNANLIAHPYSQW
jgi:CYTH domain-containing protein